MGALAPPGWAPLGTLGSCLCEGEPPPPPAAAPPEGPEPEGREGLDPDCEPPAPCADSPVAASAT